MNAEPAPKPEAPAAAKAEAGEEGGSPLAPILGTVLGIIVVAIAAFSSNYRSAEAYEAEKEKAGECEERSDSPIRAYQPMLRHNCYPGNPLRTLLATREVVRDLLSERNDGFARLFMIWTASTALRELHACK